MSLRPPDFIQQYPYFPYLSPDSGVLLLKQFPESLQLSISSSLERDWSNSSEMSLLLEVKVSLDPVVIKDNTKYKFLSCPLPSFGKKGHDLFFAAHIAFSLDASI